MFWLNEEMSALSVPNRLVSSLYSQKESGKYCDINMKFGEVILRAHACVVASFSPFVDNLMSCGGVMPPFSTVVPLSGPLFTCVNCAKKVIDFMYIGKIQIEDDHLQHIKVVSEALEVSELLKICRKHLNKCCDGNKMISESNSSAVSNIEPGSPCKKDDEPKSVSISSALYAVPQTSVHCTPKLATLEVTELPVSHSDNVMDESEWSGMKCPKCEEVFMSLAKYQQHCSTHLGKTYTSCFVCNYASIRVPDVIKHLEEEDHCEKVCSICLLEVSSSQILKEHIQSHNQAQPFFCLTCNTHFQTRTALNSHIVRHLNETPFVCKECGRGFKWKHGLRSHMVTHSKMKAFLCDQCGYSTAHLRSFIDHKTVHSGAKFKCPKPDCPFISVRKESLKHHLMTHSKQRPFQCEICGQAFSQSKNLRRHAVSHNPLADAEKCPLCSYQTNRSDKFKAHFKRYHKGGEGLEINQRKRRKSCLSPSVSLENKEKTGKTLINTINKTSNPLSSMSRETSGAESSKNRSDVMYVLNLKGRGEGDNMVTELFPAVSHISGKNNDSDGKSAASAAFDEQGKGGEMRNVTNGDSQVLFCSETFLDEIDPQTAGQNNDFKTNSVFTKFPTAVNVRNSFSENFCGLDSVPNQNNASEEISYMCEESASESIEPSFQYSQISENLIIVPNERKFSVNSLDCHPANNQVVILEGAEVPPSLSDTVYVIPEGSYVVMDSNVATETTSNPSHNFLSDNCDLNAQDFSKIILNDSSTL